MQIEISSPVSRLKEISYRLYKLDSKQSSLIQIETLFLESLYIARTYNDELHHTELLNSLVKMKGEEYKQSQIYCKSIKSKERVIRLFKHYFKKTLDKALASTEK